MRTVGSIFLWVLTAITGVIALGQLVFMIADPASTAVGWVIFLAFLIASPLLGWAAWKLWTPRSSRPCPRCGMGVRKGVVVCPTCGFDFSVMVPGPPAPPGAGNSVTEPLPPRSGLG